MKISWVEPSAVSCGGIPFSQENLEALKAQGVRAIVTLTEHPLPVTTSLLSSLGLETLHVPVVDQNPPTRAQAQDVLAFVTRMKAEGKPVYVHCHAGIGRTGTMLHALYLLSGMTLDEAKHRIKSTRPTSQYLMLSDIQKEFLEALAAELAQER